MSTIYRPGATIGNRSSDDSGTLGCFAKLKATGETVLLSAAHSIFADLPGQTEVGVWDGFSCCGICGTRLGKTLPVGDLAPSITHTMQNGFAPAPGGYKTDCAIARLDDDILFSNDIIGVGFIKGTPASGTLGFPDEKAEFGKPPSVEQTVRMFSRMRNRMIDGTVLKASADWVEKFTVSDPKTDIEKGALPVTNQLLIAPRPGPGGLSQAEYDAKLQNAFKNGKSLTFGMDGDSGSVVLNSAMQVIGLLCRICPRSVLDAALSPKITALEWNVTSHVGVVTPIAEVLACFAGLKYVEGDAEISSAIEIPATSFSKTAPSAGLPPFATDLRDHPVVAQLETRRLGRFLLGKVARHRAEAVRMVNRNRQATVAWHRHQGPAFLRHLADHLHDADHLIPTEINGVPRERMLGIMADILIHYGSSELRRDVERYRTLALGIIANAIRVDDVLTSLDAQGR